jgi:acyl carrier protein
MNELEEQLKLQIMEQLNMEDLEPEDIDYDEPLFNDGLGLDSIDALELTVLLEKDYGLKIKNAMEGKKIMYSIRTMADFIRENKAS